MTALLWVVGVLAAWTIAGLGMALAVCRAIRLADEKDVEAAAARHHARLMGHDLPLAERRARAQRLTGGTR